VNSQPLANENGLRVRGLARRFGHKQAVDGLSFDADRGRVLGLLGPNGAGKTTTLLSLCGLLRPDSGTIAFDGRILGSDRGRTIALIPETPEVYGMLTVWEHLTFVARASRLAAGWERRAASLLERLGIAQERDSLGQGLSKGTRQKTLIATTVLAGTPVLLLDEPMIGLDPKGQRELRELIGDLRAGGTTVVLSTHLLESAEALCDRVIIMKAGKEVASGIVGDLRTRAAGDSLEDVFLRITA